MSKTQKLSNVLQNILDTDSIREYLKHNHPTVLAQTYKALGLEVPNPNKGNETYPGSERLTADLAVLNSLRGSLLVAEEHNRYKPNGKRLASSYVANVIEALIDENWSEVEDLLQSIEALYPEVAGDYIPHNLIYFADWYYIYGK